ncbi:MAG: hypothetical protein MRQ13_05280 [Candidatus Midichloria sp.]|nr:hypothetical protein [Candidatus Midichloria sp.]
MVISLGNAGLSVAAVEDINDNYIIFGARYADPSGRTSAGQACIILAGLLFQVP